MTTEALTVRPLFETDEYSKVQILLHGVNQATRNRECKVTYTVVCGSGLMVVEGESHVLKPGVQLEVLPGKAYQDVGHVSMLAVSEPPFYPEQVEIVEHQLSTEQIAQYA